MRICIIAEGCYPYVVGGVSSWIHGLIKSFPKQEFVILAVAASRSMRGKYAYELPENVLEVHELYMDDFDWGTKGRHKKKMTKAEYNALRSLVLDQDIDWKTLFDLFQKIGLSLNNLLMGEDFLNAVTDFYLLNYSQIVFSDFLWMMRSLYLPLFYTLKMKVPKADLYHCLSTGYAGILGCMGKYFYGGKMIISEHGIYTREREEELIKAKWLQGIYKNIWIDQFHKLARAGYNTADLVTSLYEHARELQIELGCPVEKTMIIHNGVAVGNLQDLPGKTEADWGKINIGAILRVTPIKDIKTMIQAFAFAKEREPRLKLWIMGTWEENEEYAQECFDLVNNMGISNDIEFTGNINIKDYLGRMDMTILTSISEGQPLTILESFAAHKPVIATNVGNCSGLILGENDTYGPAGIVTHIMNVEEITLAMVKLAQDEELRRKMGENGYKRVIANYQIQDQQNAFRGIYKDFSDYMGLKWQDDPVYGKIISPADSAISGKE